MDFFLILTHILLNFKWAWTINGSIDFEFTLVKFPCLSLCTSNKWAYINQVYIDLKSITQVEQI